MEDNKSLAMSMQQTIEYGNLEFVGDLGEIMLDAVLKDGVLKDIPILGAIVGVAKCIRNVYDVRFARKLIAFLVPIKEVSSAQRAEAVHNWEHDKDFRGKVGDTLIGMIERCDDNVKATWLSKLFYELVLKRQCSRLFMRAEKVLSSLSVMDVQALLNRPREQFHHLRESDCEPYLGSGLYRNPMISDPVNGKLDLGNNYCEPTEIGVWIYYVLNNISMPQEIKQKMLF